MTLTSGIQRPYLSHSSNPASQHRMGTLRVVPLQFGETPETDTLQKKSRAARLFIRLPGFEQNWHWAEAMDQVITEHTAKVETFPRIRDLADSLAKAYHQYVEKNGRHTVLEGNPFGLFRAGDLWTPVSEKVIQGLFFRDENLKYKPYTGRIKKLIQQADKSWKKFSETEKLPFFARHLYRAFYQELHITTARLHGEEVPLTKVVRCLGNLYWIHTSPGYGSRINQHLDNLYTSFKEIQAEPKSPALLKQTLETVAEIHWWFAQMCPYQRGSAGIGDMMTKVLLDSAGIQSSPWRPELAPDMEALVTPLQEYIRNYAGFFETPPSWSLTA